MGVKEKVFLNGKFISVERAKISPLCPGLLSAEGVFETMRSYKGAIVYFNQHLVRLYSSCRILKVKPPYPKSELKEVVLDTVKLNGFADSRIRITFWRQGFKEKSFLSDMGVLILVKEYTPVSFSKYKKGFRICVSSERQNEYSLISNIKTINRCALELSFQEALRRGFDEAILLNTKGFIAEASRSNIFFVKANKLFTPSLECGCLPGITRQVVIDIAKRSGIKVIEGKFVLNHLYKAEEAFLTNSLIGVMPLTRVENKFIGKNQENWITALCSEKYGLFLK